MRDDFDLIREFRSEVPAPDGSGLAEGRARLINTISSERIIASPPRRLLLPPRLSIRVVTAAAVVAIAGTVTGLALTLGAHRAEPPSHVAPRPAAATLAVRILRHASDVAQRKPVPVVPAPEQWIYTKTVSVQYQRAAVTDEEWTTFDGSRSAYFAVGQLIVRQPGPAGGSRPRVAYDALTALPSDPGALLAAIGKAARSGSAANLAAGNPLAGVVPATQAQREFDYLSRLLWDAAAGVGGPPKAEAASFRAMATLPGITVQRSVTDAAGAPAIAVSDSGGRSQLLLDPVTFQVLGMRQFSDGIGPVRLDMLPASARAQLLNLTTARQRAAWVAAHRALLEQVSRRHGGPRAGEVIESLAYAQVSEVTAPGSRIVQPGSPGLVSPRK